MGTSCTWHFPLHMQCKVLTYSIITTHMRWPLYYTICRVICLQDLFFDFMSMSNSPPSNLLFLLVESKFFSTTLLEISTVLSPIGSWVWRILFLWQSCVHHNTVGTHWMHIKNSNRVAVVRRRVSQLLIHVIWHNHACTFYFVFFLAESFENYCTTVLFVAEVYIGVRSGVDSMHQLCFEFYSYRLLLRSSALWSSLFRHYM